MRSRWCHAACFEGHVLEEWHYWLCVPRRVVIALDDGPRMTVKPLPASSFSTQCTVHKPTCSSSRARSTHILVHSGRPSPLPHRIFQTPSTLCAYLGMPKPFIGPPLDLALDAHIAGNSARFIQNGHCPNAVPRPFLCPRSQQGTESLLYETSKPTKRWCACGARAKNCSVPSCKWAHLWMGM